MREVLAGLVLWLWQLQQALALGIPSVVERPVSQPQSDPWMMVGGHLNPNGIATTSSSADVAQLSAIGVTSAKWACRNPRFLYWNGYDQSASTTPEQAQNASTNGLVINGAELWSSPTSALAPITFGGAVGYTFTGTGGYVWSDPVQATIPANSTWTVRTAATNIAGTAFPGYYGVQLGTSLLSSTDGEGVASGTSQSAINASYTLTSGVLPTGGNYHAAAFGPIGMACQGWDGSPVLLIQGDSICYGKADAGDPNIALRFMTGYINRGFDDPASGRWAFTQWCEPTESAASNSDGSTSPGNYGYRLAMIAALQKLNPGHELPFTTDVVEHGGNNASTTQTVNQAFWSMIRSAFGQTVPILQTTITPHTQDTITAAQSCTSGTGAYCYTDTAHQAPANASWNAGGTNTSDGFPFCGTGAGTENSFMCNLKNGSLTGWGGSAVNGVIDIVPCIYYPGTTDWYFDSFNTTIATGGGYSAGATSISLNAAPNVGDTLVVSPGTTSSDAYSVVDTGNYYVASVTGSGPYTASLVASGYTYGNSQSSFVEAQVAGATVKRNYTSGGLHATTPGYLRMASCVETAKQAELAAFTNPFLNR